ncbi:hypothetical protein E2320_015441, partial [Naja naja]
MPQLSGGGDDLGANDEMIAFKDEGEQEEKIQANAFTEGDLADLKSSLVNESESSGGGSSNRQASNPAATVAGAAAAAATGALPEDPGMYKGSPYSGYPFLMLSDPYLSNGSMSPLESMCKQTVYQGPCNHEQDAGEQDSAVLRTVLLSLEGTDSQSEDLPILMDRDVTSVARETFCQLWLMNL